MKVAVENLKIQTDVCNGSKHKSKGKICQHSWKSLTRASELPKGKVQGMKEADANGTGHFSLKRKDRTFKRNRGLEGLVFI